MPWFRHLLGVATLVILVVGASYLWSLLGADDSDTGFRLTLVFENAQGLRDGAGVRYRGVRAGEVRAIDLGVERGEVRVHCRFSESAASQIQENSRFWIVRPQFRGIAEGASGLDTLIKDPYIVFETPHEESPAVVSGARLQGLERAPSRPMVGIEQGARAGDIQFAVLFDENPGLKAGAAVLYRGQPVGNVTSVSLTPTGSAVDVRAVVTKDFRSTIRKGARFWIARPAMSVEWMSGLRVHDIERLLSGTALSYAPPTDPTAPPAVDNAFFEGLNERPDIDWDLVAGAGVQRSDSIDDERFGPSLVRVHYRFVETDFWSPDDEHRFETLGVVIVTADDVAITLVPRSAVDGRRMVTDGIGEPDIAEESWHVRLQDGSVHAAARIWMTDGDSDLAVLRLDPRAKSGLAPPTAVAFPKRDTIPAAIEVIGLDDDGSLVRLPGTVGASGELRGPAASIRRGVLISNDRLIGVTSIRAGSARATLFSNVPPSFRSRE